MKLCACVYRGLREFKFSTVRVPGKFKMSCEPGRKAAYSVDLRYRMVWQQVAMELPFKIAKNLSVSIGTVHNICRRFESTGCVDTYKPDCTNTRVLSQHELLIIGLVMDNPSLYLGEICSRIQCIIGIIVTSSTICRIIH